MVSKKSVDKQLKAIGFNHHGWGRGELRELPHILLPDEEVYEVVNGFYEGGFALLVATDVRLLLIDKKPLNYLTVEDLRFDMINEMDYSHRLIGAQISIATGNKTLKFHSLNQPRLRKLIGHVQHSMADAKRTVTSHQEDQKTHLEQINQQLQAYLVAQHQQQLQLQQMQQAQAAGQAALPPPPPEPVRPSPELSDFLYAQSLLAQYQAQTGAADIPARPEFVQQVLPQQVAAATPSPLPPPPAEPVVPAATSSATPTDELYNEGVREVFGKAVQHAPPVAPHGPLEINPITVAYSKLPMALRNRKFGRPDFRAHSQAVKPTETQPVTP